MYKAFVYKYVLAILLAIPLSAGAAGFTLESPDLPQRKPIANLHVFHGFGCTGNNVSPRLTWKNPPRGTRSFALTVFDTDAPGGNGWWHWIVIDIPADTRALVRGAGDPASAKAPSGALQLRNDFGKPGWGGPCPPPGSKPHRYVFTLYALKAATLDLPRDARAVVVKSALNGEVIDKAGFTVLYGR